MKVFVISLWKNCVMESIGDIKGIIFDYGGTLDSRGVHWSEVIWNGYIHAGIKLDKQDFRDAYVYAERFLAKHSVILPEHNFLELMLEKIKHELLFLKDKGLFCGDFDEKQREIAQYCYACARECVEEARPVLEKLYMRFPMVMVSNFYGNLNSVLVDFDLLKYFPQVIESAVVGVRKPDGLIFKMGVDALGVDAKTVLVVGDSYTKDIEPAMSIGCKTVWLKGTGWGEEPKNTFATVVINNLGELLIAVFGNIN